MSELEEVCRRAGMWEGGREGGRERMRDMSG